MNPGDARPGERVRDPLGQAHGPAKCAALPQASAPGGRTEQRQLAFRTSGLAVELEITGLGETLRVAGG